MSGFHSSMRRLTGLAATGAVIGAAMVAGAAPAAAATPGAPTIGSAVDGPGSGEATVTFTQAATVSPAITSYVATSSPEGHTGSCVAPCTSITVGSLNNGTPYTFTVHADNGTAGPESGASNSVTPAAKPTLTFNPPSALTYPNTLQLTATSSVGNTPAPTFSTSTPSKCTVTSAGLVTPVQQGTCTVAADQAGNTTHPDAVQKTANITITAVAPGAPTNVLGTATGVTTASIAFTAPASDGGAPITQYTATSNPGNLTGTCATSPCAVAGLTTGTLYTFTVTAKNSATPTPLTGPASLPSNGVRPNALSQTITFAQPTTPIAFGANPTLTATSSSGLAVTFTSITPSICTITSAGALTTVTVGTCTIRADQDGDSTRQSAPPVERDITINKATPTVTVTSSANPSVYGQPLTFTATLTNPVTSTGTVQFAINNANVGSPVGLNSAGTASYTVTPPLAVGSYTVKATYAGDTNHNTANGSLAANQVVNKADTVTTVQVNGDTITATVTAKSPATGTPTGGVAFTVGGTSIGSAQLTNGVATITGTNVGNQGVGASYNGDNSFNASTGHRTPIGPTVKTHVSSAHAKHRGWYRSPVTVSFTCTPNTAPLSNGCPGAVTKTHNGAGQAVTRTVHATDGGQTTVTVSPINIDQVKPTLVVKRKANGSLVCHAHDTLSHGATCSVHHTTSNGVVKWTAVAHDRAGNTRHKHGTFA